MLTNKYSSDKLFKSLRDKEMFKKKFLKSFKKCLTEFERNGKLFKLSLIKLKKLKSDKNKF